MRIGIWATPWSADGPGSQVAVANGKALESKSFLEGLEKSKAAAQWRAASKTVGDRARDAKVLSGIVVPKHGFSQKEICHYPPLRCVAA